MRFGETEVAGERSHVPHTHIRDPVLDLGQQGQPFLNERVVLDVAVRRRRADNELVAFHCNLVQPRYALHVDKRVVLEQAGLHGQQQLGAARIEFRGAAERREQPNSFFNGGGFV